ncbi:hypothetical protein IHV84_02750 [Acidovorax sp. IB03]|uniref:hypothetical protein n=1 Tax=Acidovorax sp. IB03 TaxID=2779366 RepID=UPI0018E6E1A2|nr:hypothetical protein [Acidovorax sp. IB03]MBJ2162893.1 hypothetical protein [Acidovorax sp. IB03]
MLNTLPLNAFQSVRPRGADDAATAKQPRKTNSSQAPQKGNVHLALDRNGRRTVSVAPRPSGITIENREQKLASEAKQARLAGGVR